MGIAKYHSIRDFKTAFFIADVHSVRSTWITWTTTHTKSYQQTHNNASLLIYIQVSWRISYLYNKMLAVSVFSHEAFLKCLVISSYMFHEKCRKRFTFNVYTVIMTYSIVGPYILPSRLDARKYLVLIQEAFLKILCDVPSHVWRKMWFDYENATLLRKEFK